MLFLSRCAVAAFAVAVVLTPTAPIFAANPIQIQQCFVTVPKPMSKVAGGTQINYVNRGKQAASNITFQVGYRNSASHYLRTVHDDGDFAPGTLIQHHFNLYNDVTYGGKHVTSCRAIAVKWSDGTMWRM
jgi:hypothetical protein